MFRLSIHLGGEAMKDPQHVALALKQVAAKIGQEAALEGTILDVNGNTVGHYRTTHER